MITFFLGMAVSVYIALAVLIVYKAIEAVNRQKNEVVEKADAIPATEIKTENPEILNSTEIKESCEDDSTSNIEEPEELEETRDSEEIDLEKENKEETTKTSNLPIKQDNSTINRDLKLYLYTKCVGEFIKTKYGEKLKGWVFFKPYPKMYDSFVNTVIVAFKDDTKTRLSVYTKDLKVFEYSSASEEQITETENEVSQEDFIAELIAKKLVASICVETPALKKSGFTELQKTLELPEGETGEITREISVKVAKLLSSSTEYIVNVDEKVDDQILISWVNTDTDNEEFDLENIA